MAGGSTIETPVTPARRILTSSFFPLVGTQRGKQVPVFPGQDEFEGDIITEREVSDLSVFSGKKVLVAGFGKSALDMATFAVEQASEVHHPFRTPRWVVPFRVMGVHSSRLLFCRMGTALMPSWVQPNAVEAFIHRKLGSLVRTNRYLVQCVARFQKHLLGVGKSKTVKDRLASLTPEHNIIGDFRSASAMQPQMYLKYIAQERLVPHQGELQAFTKNGVIIKDGQTIDCDLVVLKSWLGLTDLFCLKNIASCWRANLMVCSFIVTCCTRISPGWRLQALTMALCTFRRLKSACCGCLQYSGELTCPTPMKCIKAWQECSNGSVTTLILSHLAPAR